MINPLPQWLLYHHIPRGTEFRWLTRAEFLELGEYSCSTPTGVIAGKRWRANLHAYPGWSGMAGGGPWWWEAEYVPHPDKADHCLIAWRKILFIDGWNPSEPGGAP